MKLLYEGPSLLDGAPIVALLTGDDKPSENKKTGPMLQTYIMRADIPPHVAVKTKQDVSICGDCPMRGDKCYVEAWQDPNNIWKRYKRGNYETGNAKLFGLNRAIRVGSYGDPGAIPVQIWEALLCKASGHTGYTHQSNDELAGMVQRSVESAREAIEYQAQGWKTFRIKLPEEPLLENEVMCPFEKTGLQCIQCQMCDGKSHNVAVNVHGAQHKVNNYVKYKQNLELQQFESLRDLSIRVETALPRQAQAA